MEVTNERTYFANTFFILFCMSHIYRYLKRFEHLASECSSEICGKPFCVLEFWMVMWQNNGLHWCQRSEIACETNVNIRSIPFSIVSPYQLGKLKLPKSWHHSRLCPVLQTRIPLLFFRRNTPIAMMYNHVTWICNVGMTSCQITALNWGKHNTVEMK